MEATLIEIRDLLQTIAYLLMLLLAGKFAKIANNIVNFYKKL